MEWDELENALAWFTSAPGEWVKSGKQSMEAAAEWIWEVLQGDFNENQSNAQIVTGMVISMIPGVDQICDVRDIVANCNKINEDTSNKWAWIALVITLIGLFPVFGSLAKGCFKILIASSRKATIRIAKNTIDTDLWKYTAYYVEYGIQKLNQHLDTPAVRATLKAMRLDNPYKFMAGKVRAAAGQLNVGALTRVFDTKIIPPLRDLIGMVQRWGGAAMGTRAGHLMQTVLRIRRLANTKLAEVLAPVTDWMHRLAKRLDIEAEQAYKARVDAINPHNFKRPTNEAELAKFRDSKPDWVDEKATLDYAPTKRFRQKPNYPDLSDNAPKPLRSAYQTFHGAINAVEYPPGTVLCRIVDPASSDNSICWMTKAEFDKLQSKSEWRRKFAVKANWNANGEYVTYTVPPGKPLRAWEGVVASQGYKNADDDIEFVLEGGARQVVLDPNHLNLDPKYFSKRRPTGWAYSSFGESVSLVGVPVLKNNIYQNK